MNAARAAAPLHMWAAVRVGPRAEWIHWFTVRRTRMEARAAYLSVFDTDPATKARMLAEVRFARVIVSLESTS